MQSLPYYLIMPYLHFLKRKRSANVESVATRRKLLEKVAKRFSLPKNIEVTEVAAGDVKAEWIMLQGKNAGATIMYMHGGAYNSGSLNSHRHLVARLAAAANCHALHFDYRLAPEHPFPAALDDAFEAYQWLLQNNPTGKIILAGDSAGGGLALALTLKLLQSKAPLPICHVLFAPWVDLTCTNQQIDILAQKDAVLSKEVLQSSAAMYLETKADAQDPFASPLFGKFHNCPPVFMQVGSYDVLLGDALALEKALKSFGVETNLSVWQKMPHIWQFFAGKLPEATKALKEAGDFVNQKVQG